MGLSTTSPHEWKTIYLPIPGLAKIRNDQQKKQNKTKLSIRLLEGAGAKQEAVNMWIISSSRKKPKKIAEQTVKMGAGEHKPMRSPVPAAFQMPSKWHILSKNCSSVILTYCVSGNTSQHLLS